MTPRSWIRRLFARATHTVRKASARRRPSLEALEDRALPAVNFAPAIHFGSASRPSSVAVGDFNGDGQQDLATANTDSNNVSVLLGNRDGSFPSAAHFGTGDRPVSVAVGDFNGDGLQDLATANSFSNTVSVLV